MSRGQILGVDPVHVRELAEARAERFAGFREARERYGEPIAARRERSRHGACGWRLADIMPLSRGPGYVNRTVFPYDCETEPRTRRRPAPGTFSGACLPIACEAEIGAKPALAACS